MKNEIKIASEILSNGGIILYPSDTIWAIGCDATNFYAVSKIFKLKKRDNSKALITLVADKEEQEKITGIKNDLQFDNKPTTFIYPNSKSLAKNLIASNGSVAIRIVKDKFCQNLIKKFGKPIVSTSANISGSKNPNKFSEISKEIKNNVDYIVNLRKEEIMSIPSKIILINTDGTYTKIR